MQMRSLGKSDLQASAVGLGTWAIGGWMWGGTNEREAIEAIHASIDAGVNLLDTAPIYGFGLSEEIVGKAVRDRRDQVLLATKCGMVCNTMDGEHKFTSNAQGPDPLGHIDIRTNLRPDSIRQEVEASLRRLQTDRVDLLQPHWQESTTPIADTMGVMMELKQEGKIRGIGVCNATTPQLRQYVRAGDLLSDQELYSMLDRGIEGEQLPYCRREKIAVLAYSPLVRGLLTGKVGRNREFAEGDLRRSDPRFSVENRGHVAAMLERFQPIAEHHGLTLSQLAIAWTIAQPGLTHALCGARNRRQALENAAAGDVELAAEELRVMNEAIEACVAAMAGEEPVTAQR